MDPDVCGRCGKAFVRIHARKRKWCSDNCKAAASASRAAADGRAAEWRAATRERRLRKPDTATCAVCEVQFERRNSARRYCSRRCGSRAYHLRSYQLADRRRQFAESNSRRRARQRGAEVERFAPQEIFERDSWTCGICDVPIDRTVKVPAYLAPTIDHVVPLAAGGHHTRANVQAAHFICNARKSDRVVLEVTSDAGSTAEAHINEGAA